jgi:hypothetical protein
VAVYFAPENEFHALRNSSDLDNLFQRVDPATLSQFDPELHSMSKSGTATFGSDAPLLF